LTRLDVIERLQVVDFCRAESVAGATALKRLRRAGIDPLLDLQVSESRRIKITFLGFRIDRVCFAGDAEIDVIRKEPTRFVPFQPALTLGKQGAPDPDDDGYVIQASHDDATNAKAES
jgi:hypothetical protein